MVRRSLPPGFRFHPTDVELVMYYLKRKVMGKKHLIKAIAEVDIYKFSPSDLPDKSCLKTKDLEWYFFCPREKKYATGARVKRATENGYWKTTGKDRTICYNGKDVGARKTLVFHSGHAPEGDRTNWVMHEYRILDDELTAQGIQDTCVLCKVFKKNGPGPQNGAQYGAPFNEEEWSDDDDDGAPIQATPTPPLTDFSLPTTLMLPEKQTCPSSFLFHGSTSGLSSTDGPLPSTGVSSTEVPVEGTNDEMIHLLAQFTAEPFNENGINKGELVDKGKKKCLPCLDDRHEIYNGLDDLDSQLELSNSGFDVLEMLKDGCSLDNLLYQDNPGFIEIEDLQDPLSCLNGVVGADHSPVIDMLDFHNQVNVEQLHSGSCFVNQHASCANQLPVLPNELSKVDSLAGTLPMFNDQFHYKSDTTYVLDEQPDIEFTRNTKRGSQYKEFINPAHAPTAASRPFCLYCGGSPMHIKAEVTHRAGECTNEALLFMMGGVGQLLVQPCQHMWLWSVSVCSILLPVSLFHCCTMKTAFLSSFFSLDRNFILCLENERICRSILTWFFSLL